MRLVIGLFALAACTGDIPFNAGDDDGPSPDAGTTSSDPDAGTTTTVTVMRGVDRASAFSVAEATNLKNNHGVQWTGVYIGGPCSAGSGWTKTLLTTLHTQLDWQFMPVYVGQQSSSICSSHTLTATQGQTDGTAAVARMKDFGWEPNLAIPVALDLEAGTYTYSGAGSRAYAKAWLETIRAAGYLGYIYSNPTAINGMYDDGLKFDGAWPASWFFSGFHASKPEDLTQLGTRYTHQNRAWQYAGDFAVSGAGSVDGNSSDLLLAPEPGGSNK
jgi:hypothetical protein